MKKTIITIISLLIVLSVLIYGYEFIFKKPIIESPTIEESTDDFLPTLEVKEQYKNSTYTFVGSIQVPTPCHSVASKVNKISDSEYQIELTTVSPAKDIVCAQVVTDKSFKVSFQAPVGVKVTAILDGVPYQINRFVIPNDQNIDTFQLEVKG